MDIDEKMGLIENMANMGLPMVGFSNFIIEKKNDIDVDKLGERYLKIIKEYNCCGVGNRPHYLRVEVPGGNEEIVIRRFFDGLSGAQFYANRFYGVLNLRLTAFDDQVDSIVLECMRSYLTSNLQNLRFVLSDVPKNSIKDILKWNFADIYVIDDRKPDVHEYVSDYLYRECQEFPYEKQTVLETMLSRFPYESWERVMEFAFDNNNILSIAIDDQQQQMDRQPGRIGFSV